MSKVVLKYSGLGPVSMPIGAKTGLGMAVIKPGVCEVDAENWPAMQEQPDIKAMLERGKKDPNGCRKDGMGNLVVVSEPGKEKAESSETNDESDNDGEKVPGNQGDAVALIEETEDTELLRKWLAGDTRAKVKNALEKKLKAIEDYREEHGDKTE